MVTSTRVPLPSYDGVKVVVPAPGGGPGKWSGAASAVLVDGGFWLTWRERRPLTDGRGVAVIVARSDDGESFTQVAEVRREEFGAESFERPVLVHGVGWRLYLSCATPDSKHWWVDTLTAATPGELQRGHRQVVLPGDPLTAVKDPVVRATADGFEMWLCVHPLDRAGHEDRMSGTLARRQTWGGTNAPSRAPVRTTGPSTAGRQPGGTKLRELSRGISGTCPTSRPRNRQARSTSCESVRQPE